MAIDFNAWFNPHSFKSFLRTSLLWDKFNEYPTPEKLLPWKTQYFVNNEIYRIWDIKDIDKDVSILQIRQKSKNDPRVSLTKDTFKLMQDYWIRNAIVVLWVDNISSWRLSLLTTSYTEDFKKELSNPRRYSYILWPYEKVKTPEKYLVDKWFIEDFGDLKNRFDVEVVRKEFFRLYIDLFLEVYDNIITNNEFSKIIKDWDIEPVSFSKNLMWKLIFLYFIQKKWWLWIIDKNIVFWDWDRDFFKYNIDKLAADWDLFNKQSNFYNDFLEPLFYSWLNQKNPDNWHEELQMKVPYLNGWLFQEEYDWRWTTINLNNQIFKNIIDSFDTYNFTIDEDDPYDREIAVDPEMLWKIFESMISITNKNINEHLDSFKKAKERSKISFVNQDNILNLSLTKWNNKELGAFYTPREIVNYMTKESLYNYLVNDLEKKNPNDKEEIKDIVRKLFEYKEKHLTKGEIDEQEESWYILIKKYVFDIKDALLNVKILDPAVWSWAFPMWILQEILWLTRYLIDVFHLEKKSDYEIKKDIIQNNIHGVDIDPGAVDIARLRFWLCLIVDADNPVPLPNLDFKFVCANTLVPLDEWWLFVNEEFVSTLKNIKDKFFSCSDHEEKNNLKKLFLDTKESLFIVDKNKLDSLKWSDGRKTKAYKEEYKKYVNTLADKRVKQMLQRDPFDTQQSNERFDLKMMFDIDHFDIVIWNPPYIQLQKELDDNPWKNLGSLYEPFWFKTFEKRGDIYCLFYEKWISFLNDWWILTYITSNKWMRTGYWKSLREFFCKNTSPLMLIDLWPDVFETATVDSNILITQKLKTQSFNLKWLDLTQESNISDIDVYYDKIQPISNLTSDSWIIVSDIEKNIKDKVEKVWTPLKDWDISINYWIKTWANDVFIISWEIKDKLIKEDPKSAEIIRRFF